MIKITQKNIKKMQKNIWILALSNKMGFVIMENENDYNTGEI